MSDTKKDAQWDDVAEHVTVSGTGHTNATTSLLTNQLQAARDEVKRLRAQVVEFGMVACQGDKSPPHWVSIARAYIAHHQDAHTTMSDGRAASSENRLSLSLSPDPIKCGHCGQVIERGYQYFLDSADGLRCHTECNEAACSMFEQAGLGPDDGINIKEDVKNEPDWLPYLEKHHPIVYDRVRCTMAAEAKARTISIAFDLLSAFSQFADQYGVLKRESDMAQFLMASQQETNDGQDGVT